MAASSGRCCFLGLVAGSSGRCGRVRAAWCAALHRGRARAHGRGGAKEERGSGGGDGGGRSACGGILPQGIVHHVTADAIAADAIAALCRRPFPLCLLGATTPVGPRAAARPVCGPLFLSMLNYRAANCPCIAAPFYVGAECPATLFYISAQPKPSVFGWLFITHLSWVVNGELGQFALNHQHFMWLPCLCFPCRTSLQ
jgi:hypothetical protein